MTPVGAEKAGNKEGTIPAWEGGITKPPANYKLGDFHPDPFAADKAALVAFLRTLDDTALAGDARFSSPFRR